MRFRSNEIDPADGGRRLTIVGDLTIRDVTREVQVVVDHAGPEPLLAGASTIDFRGKVSIRRQDFGLRWRDELEHSRLVAADVVDIDLKINVRGGAK